MAIEKFTFLDEVGIQNLSTALLGKVNLRIGERIVQEINDSSDDKHIPSAAILNTLLKAQSTGANTAITALEAKVTTNTGNITALDTKVTGVADTVTTLDQKVNSLTHLTIDTVTGPITSVENPSTGILYLQRDDETDKTWILYMYRAAVMEGETETKPAEWIAIGDTSVDLVGYWKKTDVDAMREALGVHDVSALTTEAITAVVEKAFTDTAVFTQALQ